jgi:hypothetical protein
MTIADAQAKTITTVGVGINAASTPGRLHRTSGAPMRLLREWHDHERSRTAVQETKTQ